MTSKYISRHPWKSVNLTLDEIGKLQHDKQYRDKSQRFFIEGVRNFVKIVDNKFSIAVIVYNKRLLTAPLARKLVRQQRRAGVPTLNVSPENFRSISQAQHASGVAAIVHQRWTQLSETSLKAGLCWIVLGKVRSTGNFGTLIRTSEAVGGAGFILLNRSVDPYAPTTIRASMGGIFQQQFIKTNPQILKAWIEENNGQVVGASPDGCHDFHQFDYAQTRFLFLGEERKGLTQQQRIFCDHLVRIPMASNADSLNLGVAGSLLMYELYRAKNI